MNKNSFIIFGIVFSLIIVWAGSCGSIGAGTHGKIKSYELSYSKSEVNEAIKHFLETSPQYKVPDNYYRYTWHYGGDSTTNDEWIQQANADSVSFSFYFPNESMIIWCSFVGHADDWSNQNSILSLIGYIKPNETKWKFDADISSKEKREITDKFESLILNKISDELKKN